MRISDWSSDVCSSDLLDPFSGAAFVFRSKRADRIKILVWDRTGLVLVHKRLEGGKFVWPGVRDGVMRMSPAQAAALFEGLDWRDRKSVVKGKSVSVRVDLGGRRIIKKTTQYL